MKVSELRIGNYIEYFGKIKIVLSIKREGSAWIIGCGDTINDLVNVQAEIDAFKPIELNEYWYERFKFKKWNNRHHPEIRFDRGVFEASINTETKKSSCVTLAFDSGIGGSGYDFWSNAKNVHELQNLWFCINSEEIE